MTTTGTDPRAPLHDWEVLDVLVKYGGERIVAGPAMDALIADLVLLANEGRLAVHEKWRAQEATR